MYNEQQSSPHYQESKILKSILTFITIILFAIYIFLAIDSLSLESFYNHLIVNLIGYIFLIIILIYGFVISFRNTLFSGIAFFTWYLLIITTFFAVKGGFGTYQLFDVLFGLTFLGFPLFTIGISFILIWWKPRSKWG